ncbi:hypothetical protein E2C01_083341 [Portunus trituberculatus]|uniref:Uncharacterized protein n=1 Tax=Portunus trituberculatus TaxID=210409 RepID=A0A5B7J6B5_PORTR|nr:hypothetical protein [Portunus trituberculatus]
MSDPFHPLPQEMGDSGRAPRRARVRVPRGGGGPQGVGAPHSERRPYQVLGADHHQQSDTQERRNIRDSTSGNVLLVSAGDSDANGDGESIQMTD